jgi:hypothetical protein
MPHPSMVCSDEGGGHGPRVSGAGGQRWYLHDEVKAPGYHSVHLALSMPTAIDDRSARLRLVMAVEPLPAQHNYEHSEEGGGKTRVKDGSGVDGSGTGDIPLGESGTGTGQDTTGRNTGDNLEEGVCLFLEIWLELVLNVADEGGRGHGG